MTYVGWKGETNLEEIGSKKHLEEIVLCIYCVDYGCKDGNNEPHLEGIVHHPLL
jgi:hypothetical protein